MGQNKATKQRYQENPGPECLTWFSCFCFPLGNWGSNEATEGVLLDRRPRLTPLTTYHILLSSYPTLSLPFVEGAVMPCGLFPGAVEVIGHEVDEVQAPAGDVEGVEARRDKDILHPLL